MWFRKTMIVPTSGRSTVSITEEVAALVHQSGVGAGLCHLFNQHTSASLVLSENADPAVRRDFETFLAATVPDGSTRYSHDQEGDDDMPAHIRTLLTGSDLTIPIDHNRMMLGTWQGIYLYEHRTAAHRRSVVVTVFGN
ncbi:MAG: hypothetical protein DHS20C01_18620 [marine bacterium B5-7]|nr:MAG: hypothetical protein DHS20C01_18620 [marine bacterium B5-7]